MQPAQPAAPTTAEQAEPAASRKRKQPSRALASLSTCLHLCVHPVLSLLVWLQETASSFTAPDAGEALLMPSKGACSLSSVQLQPLLGHVFCFCGCMICTALIEGSARCPEQGSCVQTSRASPRLPRQPPPAPASRRLQELVPGFLQVQLLSLCLRTTHTNRHTQPASAALPCSQPPLCSLRLVLLACLIAACPASTLQRLSHSSSRQHH